LAKLQPVRGTRDILPEDMRRQRAVVEACRRLAERYGYHEMATPVFEFTDVFKRTLGETSDIVTKEMYTFPVSEEGDSVTLRPEATAGVARAFITNGLQQDLPQKLFYTGPMFRHERPQKGRLRQFHQVDVELLGVAQPVGDVEMIALARHFLQEIGLDSDRITLEINTLGDLESRKAYRQALIDYFQQYASELSDDSRARLHRNPLRILDSKDPGDRKLVAGAPAFDDYLNKESKDFFRQVLDGLRTLGISYEINPRLVRGLDYYTHTCFEFTTDQLGAQGTVLAGGRYDGLIEQMGGASTPGIGWAAGVERLAMLLATEPQAPRPIAVVPAAESQESMALELTQKLRRQGFCVEIGYTGNLRKRLKRADRVNARAAVILGEEEAAKASATLRDLDSGAQETVSLNALGERLAQLR
jgi:histidyl-tRNA synthetase